MYRVLLHDILYYCLSRGDKAFKGLYANSLLICSFSTFGLIFPPYFVLWDNWSIPVHFLRHFPLICTGTRVYWLFWIVLVFIAYFGLFLCLFWIIPVFIRCSWLNLCLLTIYADICGYLAVPGRYGRSAKSCGARKLSKFTATTQQPQHRST